MAQYGNGVTYGVDVDETISGSTSYTTVGEVYSVDFGGISADAIDSTVHGDTWRTFVGGLKNAGTVTIGVRFGTESASHKEVLDNIGTLCAHMFTWPKNTAGNTTAFSIEADGVIQSSSLAGPHDGLLDMQITLQLSGAPTITAEAA